MSESGTFETREDNDTYIEVEEAPSPKRARFENAEIEQTEIVHEGDDTDTVHITVPQTQFEIEINSGGGEEGDSPCEGIHPIQAHNLSGPTFEVIHQEELSSLEHSLQPGMDSGGSTEGSTAEDSNTLNAIGRALLQMQQSGTQSNTMSQNQVIITSHQGGMESGQSTAPLYVMIPPSSSAEILQAMGQSRPIAPKMVDATSPGNDVFRKTREAARKATHNEVERRRRDRINEMIKTLAQVVPGCQKKDATTGNVVGYVYSKGTVLDKTVEFLKELIAQNEQLAGTAKLAEKSANALSLLQNQITVLEKENAFLRAQIIQLGIDAANNTQSNLSRQLLSTPLAQSLLNTSGLGGGVQPSGSSPSAAPTITQTAAQHLLLSLAQSLTNSPLLTSLAQNPASASTSLTPSPLTAGTSPPSRLTPSQLTPHLAAQLASPQLSATPLPSHSSPAGSQLSQISSLVQTLASIANTSTTQSSPVPKVSLPSLQPGGQSGLSAVSLPSLQPGGQSGLSAAAAASLLNTILLAQNVLSGASSSSQGSSLADSGHSGATISSVLNPVGMDGEQGGQQ